MRSVWLQGFAYVQYWEEPQHPDHETGRRVLAALAMNNHIGRGCQAGIALHIHTSDAWSMLMSGGTELNGAPGHSNEGFCWLRLVIISIDVYLLISAGPGLSSTITLCLEGIVWVY